MPKQTDDAADPSADVRQLCPEQLKSVISLQFSQKQIRNDTNRSAQPINDLSRAEGQAISSNFKLLELLKQTKQLKVYSEFS